MGYFDKMKKMFADEEYEANKEMGDSDATGETRAIIKCNNCGATVKGGVCQYCGWKSGVKSSSQKEGYPIVVYYDDNEETYSAYDVQTGEETDEFELAEDAMDSMKQILLDWDMEEPLEQISVKDVKNDKYAKKLLEYDGKIKMIDIEFGRSIDSYY